MSVFSLWPVVNLCYGFRFFEPLTKPVVCIGEIGATIFFIDFAIGEARQTSSFFFSVRTRSFLITFVHQTSFTRRFQRLF